MRLAIALVLRLMVLAVIVRWSSMLSSGRTTVAAEIDVNPPFVLLGVVLHAEFAAHFFNLRFDLLDMIRTVVALPDDNVQM